MSMHKARLLKFSKATGQSLLEYVIPAALVALVSIAGLMLVGQNLSGYFTGLKGDMHQQKMSAAVQKYIASKRPSGPTNRPADPATQPAGSMDGTTATDTPPALADSL